MQSIAIDPDRLAPVQAASIRERAALNAAQDRLSSALAAFDGIEREIRTVKRRLGYERDAVAQTELAALQRRHAQGEAEIVEASALVEEAKDRVSATNRLRNACETFVTCHRAGEAFTHVR